MRCATIPLVAILSFAALGLACATEKHACDAPGRGHKGGAACPMEVGASPTAVPPGSNAVQNEMRLLNHAWHLSMSAAALGDVSIVPGLFHTVHQARALTDKAVEGGTWKPAKGDLAAFKALDQAFHGELEKVVQAAVANDRTAVVDGLNHLLPSCVACHDAHREPGLPASMMPTPAAHPEHPKGEHPKGDHPEHPKGSEHPEHPKG